MSRVDGKHGHVFLDGQTQIIFSEHWNLANDTHVFCKINIADIVDQVVLKLVSRPATSA